MVLTILGYSVWQNWNAANGFIENFTHSDVVKFTQVAIFAVVLTFVIFEGVDIMGAMTSWAAGWALKQLDKYEATRERLYMEGYKAGLRDGKKHSGQDTDDSLGQDRSHNNPDT